LSISANENGAGSTIIWPPRLAAGPASQRRAVYRRLTTDTLLPMVVARRHATGSPVIAAIRQISVAPRRVGDA